MNQKALPAVNESRRVTWKINCGH